MVWVSASKYDYLMSQTGIQLAKGGPADGMGQDLSEQLTDGMSWSTAGWEEVWSITGAMTSLSDQLMAWVGELLVKESSGRWHG